MSRRLDYTISFDAPAEEVYQDFTSREYWANLIDSLQSKARSEITHFSSNGNGTDMVFTADLPQSYLPPMARNLLPINVKVTREQHYDIYDHARNRATGTCGAALKAGPGYFNGHYFRGRYYLTETDSGSRLQVSGVCKINVPLLGGKLEDQILQHIPKVLDAEEAFMADWISQHH
jgi:Protein of unknown function (DUF2505)